MLAFHERSTWCCIVAPEPVVVSTAELGLELLLKKEMFAETAPLVVGEKLTLKGMLWPAARVTGRVSPPSVKTELLELAEDKVTLPPLAVKLPF